MKKLLLCTVLFFSVTAFANKDLEKAEKAFLQSFPTATDVKWYKDGDMAVVRFVKDKVTAELTYDANANIVKTVRYYLEDNLPPMIVAKLKTKYPDKKIFGVTEIFADERVEYHIVLEDTDRWYDVVCDAYGNSSLKNKFKKA
ncbi:MAG: hypothetical protein M3342_02015 [Bacteroidota bacterium]|nr:hypothetical protein [Flavisolibacter sp.]MDQ3842778.1 hypothetical protein [Bacteroidota bacterium]MBD0285339.1 hypothetical protein [Flavisolibacter sp.]MBD0352195.1 hypothetical protein [Flavisolibacter sp.]MBD0365750.1 hypothetical protein [Flavisolibacter sp.]